MYNLQGGPVGQVICLLESKSTHRSWVLRLTGFFGFWLAGSSAYSLSLWYSSMGASVESSAKCICRQQDKASLESTQQRYHAQTRAATAPSALTVMTISNSPHPCSVTSYGGCESSLVGFWKLECSWNTTFMMDQID